jgi:hypothetical protein
VAPSAWILVIYWSFAALVLVGATWALARRKLKWYEVLICLIIVLILGAILYPVYFSQAVLDARAKWRREHPGSRRHFE